METLSLPTLEPEHIVVHYLPVDPLLIFALIFFAVFFVFVHATVRTVLDPWRQQKKREIRCDHSYTLFKHEQPGRPVFYTWFCKKCGGRHVITEHTHVGQVKKPAARKKETKT